MNYDTWTRYPTEQNDEYKYWGWYGPSTPRRMLLAGALTFFVVIPLVLVGIVALVALILVALAVPPVGIMCVKAICAAGS